MPKLKRDRKKTEKPEVETVLDPTQRKRIQLAVKATEGYVLFGCIAMGPGADARIHALKRDSRWFAAIFAKPIQRSGVRGNRNALFKAEYFSHYAAKAAFKHNTIYSPEAKTG